jgi:tRNA-specific 2-thiouridylase
MSKRDARDAARQSDLAVAEKAESQEICFVPDGNYAGFIDRYLEAEGKTSEVPAEGEIFNVRGEKLGVHNGIHRYTIGQRRGLNVLPNSTASRPLYVISINGEANRVVVGEAEELMRDEFVAASVNWVAFNQVDAPVRAEVRVRYRHEAAPAMIEPQPENRVRVIFDEPQRAVTPGQATVFYRGDEVLGGGWIVKR